MLGSEDGTVSVGLEDGNILGKTEDGGSLGKMLEDSKALGSSLGTEIGASLGKGLDLKAGIVFVGLEDGVKARLLAMEDSCELLVLMSGGMQGLEDGKALGK